MSEGAVGISETLDEIFELMFKLSVEEVFILAYASMVAILQAVPVEKRPGALMEICTEVNKKVRFLDSEKTKEV